MPIPEIELSVYPDECDAFGHLNQASFLSLFERARWEMLARGPGMDVFTRQGSWPAVRRATIDYQAAAYPGDVLRFDSVLTHHGRTSFTLRQSARRVRDDAPIATAEFVFVCINREGRPVPVPPEIAEFLVTPIGPDALRRVMVHGVSLAVDVQGEGPAVLMIHGYPMDHTIWAGPIADLAGWCRIAPDLRGFGGSDAPDLGYSIPTYADDLAALLDAMSVERVVICGLSMGGYIALEFVRRWRERVRGLVLMDTRAEPDSAEAKRGRDQQAALARDSGAAAVAQEMAARVLSPAATESVRRSVREMMAQTPVAGIVGALSAMRDRADSRPLLSTLAGIPTLVVAGADDPATPPESVATMAAAIPGARFERIPGAGHIPPVEQPELTSRLLREFLSTLGGG